MMQSDKNKTKDELIRELKALKSQFNERTASFEQECFERGRTEEALRLAQVIIDNSPAILFRRMAGNEPARWGIRPRNFSTIRSILKTLSIRMILNVSVKKSGSMPKKTWKNIPNFTG
jgi:hypothetical protein